MSNNASSFQPPQASAFKSAPAGRAPPNDANANNFPASLRNTGSAPLFLSQAQMDAYLGQDASSTPTAGSVGAIRPASNVPRQARVDVFPGGAAHHTSKIGQTQHRFPVDETLAGYVICAPCRCGKHAKELALCNPAKEVIVVKYSDTAIPSKNKYSNYLPKSNHRFLADEHGNITGRCVGCGVSYTEITGCDCA